MATGQGDTNAIFSKFLEEAAAGLKVRRLPPPANLRDAIDAMHSFTGVTIEGMGQREIMTKKGPKKVDDLICDQCGKTIGEGRGAGRPSVFVKRDPRNPEAEKAVTGALCNECDPSAMTMDHLPGRPATAAEIKQGGRGGH